MKQAPALFFLLLALAGCGTMRAVKQGVEALGDDAVERRQFTIEARKTNERLDALAKRVDEEVVPAIVTVSAAVERTADASTSLLGKIGWILLGSVGGYFSILKTAGGRWLWRKLGLARKRRKRPKPKP